MRIDKTVKALLAVCAVSLTVLATQPIWAPLQAQAAMPDDLDDVVYEMRNIRSSLDGIQDELDELNRSGLKIKSSSGSPIYVKVKD